MQKLMFMDYMKTFFSWAAVFCFVSASVFAAEKSSISDSTLAQLKKEGVVKQTFVKEEEVKFSYTPNTEFSKNAILSWTNDWKPKFSSENLFYLDKQTLVSSNNDVLHVSIDTASKILRSISKMKGMEYFSEGDQKWETLYHKSYLIKSKDDKSPVPDDLSGSADGKNFYCLQEDNSLGICVYKLDYRQSENEFAVCFTNIEPVKYGPITCVRAGDLKMNVVIIDEGEYFLVYMVVQSCYPYISILENRMNKSFNNRVDAIYKWFCKQF